MSAISVSLVALLFPVACHHFNVETPMREINPGILAELKVNDAKYEAGFYANSIGRTTFTVQRRFSGWSSDWVDIGGRLGVCTGYRGFAAIPCGGVSIRAGGYLDLTLVPPVGKLTHAVAAVSFRMPL